MPGPGLQKLPSNVTGSLNPVTTAISDPGDSASARFAKINREQFEDYKARYKPAETELVNIVKNKEALAKKASRDAVKNVNTYYQTAAKKFNEEADFSGMDARTRKALRNDFMTNRALSLVDAESGAYDAEKDRITGLTQDVIGLGRNVESDATSGFSQAANLETDRENTNRSLANSRKGGGTNFIGSLIGFGLSKL